MLSAKQEIFVQALVQGKTQRQAYNEAYPKSLNWKVESVETKACRLFGNPKIQERYFELLKATETKTILNAIQRKEWLSSVIISDKENTSDKLKAVDLLNKMDGQYIDKVEVKQIETDWFIDGEKA